MPNYNYGLSSAGSMQVNSQLVPVPMNGAYYPTWASSPFYKGNGQPPPTLPLNLISSNSGIASNDGASQVAAAMPFSFTQSPLPFALGALILGLLGLRYIHWRG